MELCLAKMECASPTSFLQMIVYFFVRVEGEVYIKGRSGGPYKNSGISNSYICHEPFQASQIHV